MSKQNYWALSVAETEQNFGVAIATGLTDERARELSKEVGLNSLSDIKSASFLSVLLRQLNNFFILLLFVAAVISYYVDGVLQASILAGIIILNVLFGFFQEFKAEKALSNLKASFISSSKVRRDGQVKVISNELLAPGDVVLLESGDKVPADMRVIESQSLRVDESILTGESVPRSKEIEAIDAKAVLGDRKNMLFASTTILAGRGVGVVVATGRETEFGQIAGLVSASEQSSQLEKEVAYLSKLLTIVSLVIAGIVFALGFWRGEAPLPLLTFTIALLVAVVPESLPTVITLSLAIGTALMAKKKAIIRRLGIIETLGTVNIIATDKTGTLTENRLTVGAVSFWSDSLRDMVRFDLESNDLSKRDKDKAYDLLLLGTICSNITQGEDMFLGDPLETAIASKAKEINKNLLKESAAFQRVLEAPFDSTNKFMAVLADDGRQEIMVAKGAPERMLEFCSLKLREKKKILRESEELSQNGYKVIAVSVKDSQGKIDLDDMDFVGLIAMVDEPSRGVAEALAKTTLAGIRPIIITGDHIETARYVALRVGLTVEDDEIITGSELQDLPPRQFKKMLLKVKIIARATPENKMRVVKALGKAGYSVAVTGDGVNDAPALKGASVGIAMGVKGTDVARDSADMILSNDKYTTIVTAVEYGRAIYDNIRRVVTYLLSGNFDELLLVAAAFVFNLPVPFITLQILWINLVTDSLPAIAFAFEKPGEHVLREKPRSSKASSMNEPVKNALVLGLIAFGLGFALYLWGLGRSVETARTLVFFTAILQELVYAFSLRTRALIWREPLEFFKNKFMLATIGLALALQFVLYLPALDHIFKVVPLTGFEIIVLLFAAFLAFIASETLKWYREED